MTDANWVKYVFTYGKSKLFLIVFNLDHVYEIIKMFV